MKEQNKKALWGARIIVLAIVVVFLVLVGAWIMASNKETEVRLGGPMYGIEIAAEGENKFIINGRKSVLIYENDGTDYEVTKFLIDLNAKKIWKLADRFNKNDSPLDRDIYLSEREINDDDVEDLRALYKDIMNDAEVRGERSEDVSPYVLDTGDGTVLIYSEKTINRILEAMGL